MSANFADNVDFARHMNSYFPDLVRAIFTDKHQANSIIEQIPK